MKNIASKSFLVLFLFFGYGFAVAEPDNIALLKQEIDQYTQSGQYLREVQQVARQADDYISAEIAKNRQRQHPQKLAIVLDIDETSLSNLDYINKRQYSANAARIHQEIMNADAPALAPVHDLYLNAMKNDVKVFFVTGRNSSEKEATEKNLRRAGYAKWAGIFFRPVKYSRKSIVPFKAQARQKITKMGYTILASIGDQRSDIEGGFTQRGFKVPNPFYYLK